MRRAVAVLAVLAAVSVAGCTQDAAGNKKLGLGRDVIPHYVKLPDGGQVLCIWESGGYSGGLSCDWQGAKR